MISEQNSHHKHRAQRACLSTDPRCHPALHNCKCGDPWPAPASPDNMGKGPCCDLDSSTGLTRGNGWMEGPQPGMGLSLTRPGVFRGPPIPGSDLGLPKGHPVREEAVFQELKRKKGIVRNQGQLPGGGDEERVWHIEGAAEAKLEWVQELQAAGRQGRHLSAVHCTHPPEGLWN